MTCPITFAFFIAGMMFAIEQLVCFGVKLDIKRFFYAVLRKIKGCQCAHTFVLLYFW